MSKQPEEAFIGDGELPPPYSPEPSSSSIHPDSLFAAHLTSLRGRIRAQQASRASRQDQHDSQLLALLVPHVEALLASVAALDEQLVQATLVPEGAIAADWTPAEAEDAQSVVRVRTRLAPARKMMPTDSKQPAANDGGRRGVSGRAEQQQEFDGWGRWGEDAARGGKEKEEDEEEQDKLWWKDEDMAKRLARYLQPKRKVVAVDRPTPTVAAKVAEARKSKSKWNMFGGGRKSSGEGNGSPVPAVASRPDAAVEVADDVSMHVTAEEVTFRRENEMGIWESSTGWGVVVRVRVRT